MRKEIQYFITILGLGASLIVYAHSSFASKDTVQAVEKRLILIDKRIYDLHKYFGLQKD